MSKQVKIYLNVVLQQSPAGRWRPAVFTRLDNAFRPGDPVALVMEMTSEAETNADACEEAFEVGNVDPDYAPTRLRDCVQSYRAEHVRSLSVGDVVVVDDVAYACQPMGWAMIGRDSIDTLAGRTAAMISSVMRRVNDEPGQWPTSVRLLQSLERPA